MRTTFAALSSFLVVALLVQPGATQTVTTIFSDDFSGAGGPLNGTTPDATTNAEVWEAGDTFFDDGFADSPIAGGPDGQAAHLDFVPVNGAVYTAEATVLNTNTNWVAFGFLPDDPAVADWTVQDFSVRHSNAPGYAWALTRNNPAANNQEGFLGGGTGGPQPWNGNVVDATQPVDFRIILDTTGPNWTSQWFLNDVSQGDPVAYAEQGNPGIGGIGFSHERNATANSGATIESFSLIEELAPTLLSLVVNTTTGETVLRNTSPEPVSFDYYIIESEGGALDPDGWNSLDDQGIDAGLAADFDGSGSVDNLDLTQWQGDYGVNGDSDANADGQSSGIDFIIWQQQRGQSPGPEDQWQEAGGSSTAELAELFLNGATTLDVAEEIGIGNAFDTGVFGPGNNGDLTFNFSLPGGGLQLGSVVYETTSLTAVPEPSTLGLLLVMFAAGSLVKRR